MNDTSIPDAFLVAISSRDFGGLAECLAPSAEARMLLPRGPEVRSGRDEIARRFEGWFAAGSDFSVLGTRHEAVGLRHRLTWRFRMSRNHQAPEIVEQVAFVDVGPDGINQIDLLCSGFLHEAEPIAMCSVDSGPNKSVGRIMLGSSTGPEADG
jgi:SnoaL-like domain